MYISPVFSCWVTYIDDLHHSVTKKIFADDVTYMYKVVTDASDCDLLQEDLS